VNKYHNRNSISPKRYRLSYWKIVLINVLGFLPIKKSWPSTHVFLFMVCASTRKVPNFWKRNSPFFFFLFLIIFNCLNFSLSLTFPINMFHNTLIYITIVFINSRSMFLLVPFIIKIHYSNSLWIYSSLNVDYKVYYLYLATRTSY